MKKLTAKELKELYGYYGDFRMRKHFKKIVSFEEFKKDIDVVLVEDSRNLLEAFRGISK